ncbi:hypothetical protein JNL27_17395 [bacterium]|nr:hypothetical protein [bacterium]
MDLSKPEDLEIRGRPPADAIRVASFGRYDLFISKQRKCLYVYPTEYRVGALQMSKETLMNLVQLLEE